MTANRGLFVRNNGNVGTTPIEGRLVLAELVAENAPGVPRQGLLDQKDTVVVSGASGWTYNVAACSPVLNRATNEGVYIFTLTGTTSVATTAAPGTGSRWDLIYVKQNDPDKGDADNTATVAVLQGTAAASSPTKPTANLPAGAYVLAEALVSAGATGTNHANVSITQTWRYTAHRGNPIPVRNTTERAEITTPTTGLQVARLDLDANGEVLETYRDSAWSPSRESTAPLFITKDDARNGTASGIAAKIASGQVRPIIQAFTAVVTTDNSGFWAVNYPQPFPNGILSVQVTNGDTSAAGRALILGIAGNPPFVNTTSTLYGSAWENGQKVNAPVRVEVLAFGW